MTQTISTVLHSGSIASGHPDVSETTRKTKNEKRQKKKKTTEKPRRSTKIVSVAIDRPVISTTGHAVSSVATNRKACGATARKNYSREQLRNRRANRRCVTRKKPSTRVRTVDQTAAQRYRKGKKNDFSITRLSLIPCRAPYREYSGTRVTIRRVLSISLIKHAYTRLSLTQKIVEFAYQAIATPVSCKHLLCYVYYFFSFLLFFSFFFAFSSFFFGFVTFVR